MKSFQLNWRGQQVTQALLEQVLVPAMTEFGLRCEAKAKVKLKPSQREKGPRGKLIWVKGGGRGKRTGTLQRSIHTASPGYNWDGDTGGTSGEAETKGGAVSIELGSGLEYALRVHQDHYNPEVNKFLTRAVDETRPQLPGILKKHRGEFL